MSYPPRRAAVTRASWQKKESPRPYHENGIALVDSVSLRSVQTTISSGIKVVNNSPGGGRQDNVLAKVPGLENTFAGTIDNVQSLTALYKMMPKGKLSIIVAVTPNGSGAPTTTGVLDWSVLQKEEDRRKGTFSDELSMDDDQTCVGDDDGLSEDASDASQIPEKEHHEPSIEVTAPEPPNQSQAPPTISKSTYEDLMGLVI
ncbi:hypothetical protein IL306_014431 [Fusarium sp. DS 682]|nr:hypothetical protein IL306_014431 [Fusarium sp. DS 682]